MTTHVLDLINSLEVGGAERALANRLTFAPPGTQSTVFSGFNRQSTRIDLPSEVDHVEVRNWRKELPGLIHRYRPDVVIVHSPSMLVRFFLSVRSRTRPPVVFVSHGELLSESIWKSALLWVPFRCLISKVSVAITVSTAATKLIPRRVRREVRPLGSSLAPTLSTPPMMVRPDSPVRLLSLSRLTKTKNIPLLIESASRIAPELRSLNVQVDVVGDGPEKERLVRMVEARGLDDIFCFHDSTPSPEQFLRASDFVVICSKSEGGPLTAYEATLAGAKIVATNVGVIWDIKQEFPSSVFVSPSHTEVDFSQTLLDALASGRPTPSQRAQISEKARQYETGNCATSIYELILDVSKVRS